MIDVVTLGETMALFRAESAASPEYNDRFTLAFGGADSNVAISLSRLGHQARWVSALGDDVFGRLIAKSVAEQGVECKVSFSASAPTGLMVKSPSTSAERFVSFYRAGSAASKLSPADFEDALISDASIFHFTGITSLLSDSCADLIRVAVTRARELDKTVSFDLNYRSALWSREQAQASFRSLAPMADIVFGDITELSMLVDAYSDEEQLMRKIADLGPKSVVLKLGERGCKALVENEFFESEGFEVPVVDTVGAGDAFVAGYLSGLLDGLSPAERLSRANFCGSRACMDPGDWEGAPMRSQLELGRRELI